MSRKRHGWAVASAIGLLLWIADVVAAQAGIGWERPGPFTACLDSKAQAWIAGKVELVVNDDPDMGAIDDAAVAGWATQALKDCSTKPPGADPASELQFMKYMAHWRDHIYKGAEEIRRRGRPD